MGVSTDGEETNPKTSLRDDNQLTTGQLQRKHETELADECARGIQDPKLMGATDTSLITPQQNISSQNTSVVSITDKPTPQEDNTDGGDILLSNQSYRQKEMFNSSPASFTTNSSTSDDVFTQLNECRLQTSDITTILNTDINDVWETESSYPIVSKHEQALDPNFDKMDKEGYTPLYKAALEGDFKVVDELISQGANVNKACKGGLRPLHAAAEKGHEDVVDSLILHRADTSVECDMGQTPLHSAAVNGHTCIIERLIAEGSDVNKADLKGGTPFNAAIDHGHLEAVKYLLDKGAKQNRYDEMTPLYAVARFGHFDIVKFFISNGADLNEEDDNGMIPLHGAASGGHLDIMEYLTELGSDVNKAHSKGWTPFNAAIEYGHLDAVQYLIGKGAKQNRYRGATSFYLAAQFGHLDIVKFYISSGADVNEGDDKGRIPLHGAANGGHLDIVEYLIQQESDVNKAGLTGWTPFNAAIQYGHLDVVKCLIEKGAKQNRFDGETSLNFAAKFGHFDIVEYFIFNGADVNDENDDGRIPLHGAAINGNIEIMDYLIQQGSDVNKADSNGWKPFNAAIDHGHLEAVTYLMDKGANQKGYGGMTPLYAAVLFGHLDIVRFFIFNGADVNEENDDGKIPLHGAAIKGNIEIMDYLIQQVSDVNKAGTNGLTPFNVAIQYGHLDAVTYLMDKGANPKGYGGMTPLYAAVLFGHLDIAEFFISKGADVNEDNDDGRISLHGAAIKGNMSIIEYLIRQGADVNKADSKGWTPFNAAIQYGHLEAVKYLLDKGAKRNRYDEMTPLYAATLFGHFDIVKFFISNIADVNEVDGSGMIPLHGAAIKGNIGTMESLIQGGSDVNKTDDQDWTPFDAAVQNGHLDAIKHLRNGSVQKTDVNEVDDKGMIALHAAVRNGNIEIVEYLIHQGSDVNKAGNNGMTPLIAAIIEGHLNIVKFLLDKGANYVSYGGMTPLYIGAQYHHIKVVRFLLSKGYNVNEGTESGKSPLHAACYNGNIDMVNLLLLNNADANQQDQDGWTPLQAAEQEGYRNISENLLVHGAHIKDSDDFASIHTSPNTGHFTLTERILNTHGCDEDETREQKQNDHGTAMKAECATASMMDPEKQSHTTHTKQSKLHMQNIYNENTFIQADVEDERCAEFSLRALSTGAFKGDDRANQEPNPFPGAKSKPPEQSGKGTTQDVSDAVQNRTNDASRPISLGPQRWQYSGYERPFLQTQNNSMTSYQISEDPESRCSSLTEEIGQTRKPPNLINKGNDRVTHGSSSESNRRHLSHIGATSANTGWKILSKHRTASTGRPPTILLFLQTFLQMILALAILLEGCPVHVGADGITEEVTLLAGSRGIVPFYFPVSSNDTFLGLPYYILQFESMRRPFCVNGKNIDGGFKSPTQVQRFKTEITDLDTSPSVNLIIDNVETLDQDGYLFTAIFHHSLDHVQYETVNKVFVQIPHAPAKCFITISENHKFTYEVHCRATSGSTATTISCYQNGQKLHSRNGIADDGQVTRGIFFLPFNTRLSCCSHEVSSVVSAATCNDFEWPPRADTTTHITSIVPKSVNSTSGRPVSITPSPKHDADSGAGGQLISTFLWYMTCLSICVLNFVCSESEFSLK